MHNDKDFMLKIKDSVHAIRERIGSKRPVIGVILGSGLGDLADSIQDAEVIPFSDVPHMRLATAQSHAGRFVIGELGGRCVICMQGRLHGYEGYASAEVAWPVWVMDALGVEVLITTNAAGAINPEYSVGDFCIIADHINFTGRNPLQGLEPQALAPCFPSLFEAYDPGLRKLAREVAAEERIPVQEGVYIGVAGPSLETPAEIRAFRSWGADTVAMSVVEEVIAARHAGLRVLGISLCSNMACGVNGQGFADDEIFEVAKGRVPDLVRIITGIVERIDA